MKRFKLQTGHIIKIDDADAYLMRSYVWRGDRVGSNGWIQVRRSTGSGTCCAGQYRTLAAELMSPAGDQFVAHTNGDPLDFQRANLALKPRSELAKHAGTVGRLVRAVLHA